ncbi:hypothetical protein LJC11_00195 [Bacteroidales bacterium OttesenSCG-928-I21]|nr:hypothetical protein [Bacteroidales bacterium OttesenSCG-928-I21]
MLLIYAPNNNSRIKFAVEVCFKYVLKTSYKFTADLNEFVQSAIPSIWYSKEPIIGKPGIVATDMMLDKSIVSEPKYSEFNETKILFPTEANMLPPFDLFAAVFWYVTRMEEYGFLPTNENFRFISSMSLGAKLNILQKPIVNIWVNLFTTELKKIYPNLEFDKPPYEYIPSIDVDSAYMFKHKGILRSTGGLLKDFLKADFKNIKTRLDVVFKQKSDPWFCFDKINELHEKYGKKNHVFFSVRRI